MHLPLSFMTENALFLIKQIKNENKMREYILSQQSSVLHICESNHGSELKWLIFNLDDSSRVSLFYILKNNNKKRYIDK